VRPGELIVSQLQRQNEACTAVRASTCSSALMAATIGAVTKPAACSAPRAAAGTRQQPAARANALPAIP